MMLNYINKFFLGRHHFSTASMTGLVVFLSIFTATIKPAVTKELPKPEQVKIAIRGQGFIKQADSSIKGKLPEKDGIYLYGQSPQPQQVGQEYIVIEVNRGKVVGAFYLPHSEFNCFNGTIAAGELALLLANGPESEAYPDPSGVTNNQQVATVSTGSLGEDFNNTISTPYSVALQNYHQLNTVSPSDKEILAACKSGYQGSGE